MAEDFTITNLGALAGAAASRAASINRDGVVAGNFFAPGPDGEQVSTPFTFNSRTGSWTPLGIPPNQKNFETADINNGGTVVGTSKGSQTRGYVYNGGFKAITAGSRSDTANAVNDEGLVVGTSEDGSAGFTPYRVRVGSPAERPIIAQNGTVANEGVLLDVNSAGVAVGCLVSTDFAYPGFWNRTIAIRCDGAGIQELTGLPGKTRSVATSINDAGKIVGYSYNAASDGYSRLNVEAFVIDGAYAHTLGVLTDCNASEPSSISNLDAVVGTCRRAQDGAEIAFLYTPRDGMRDLNALLSPAGQDAWNLQAAKSINESGQIVGYGTVNGTVQGFLLNPVSNVREWSLLDE